MSKAMAEARRVAKGQLAFFDKMMQATQPTVEDLKHRINVLEMDIERLKIELELAKRKTMENK